MVLSALFSPGRRAEESRLAHALRGVPLFRDMPAADLVAIWRRLQEVRLPAGTVICERGAPGDQFWVVQAGTLEVRLGLGPSGVVVRRIGPGDFLGEMALLTGAPRSTDVVAVDDVVLWALSRQDFDALLESSKSLVHAFNRALCDRVALMTLILEERGAGVGSGVAGMRFGPYRVVEQIGAGGMAAVYSAVHAATEMAVALKVLPVGWGSAPELRQRLAREAAVLQALHHSNVVQVLDVGDVEARYGGGCYLAMEWFPHALHQVLRARYPEPLAPAAALRLAQGVAEGLVAVHAAGVVHRDIKPSNILLRADGSPVLTDFGLVTALAGAASSQRLTPTNVFVGTADYLAPEQVRGERASTCVDIYSLGVVLYEMLAGYVPFAGRDPLDALRAHVEEPPPPLPGSVPPAARAVVERALQKQPEERFSSASEMVAALAVARDQVEAGTGSE
jgi:CRP-like cAMP-binding protein